MAGEKPLGQIGYEAMLSRIPGEKVGAMRFDPWDKLQPELQAEWEHIANAIASAVRERAGHEAKRSLM